MHAASTVMHLISDCATTVSTKWTYRKLTTLAIVTVVWISLPPGIPCIDGANVTLNTAAI